MKILSCGFGVNSMAIIVGFSKGMFEIDRAIFADTGGENPDTYNYIEKVAKPYIDKIGLPLTIVKSDMFPLYDYYYTRKIIPTRLFRHCTDKFKIRPITNFCKQYGDYGLVIGIAFEEKNRARNWQGIDYPLVREGIDRDGCKELIKSVGLPIPRKSGCFFCPFTPKDGWIELWRNHRDFFAKAELLEKNCLRYPELKLTYKSLEQIRSILESNKSLSEWIEPTNQGCIACELT